MHSRTSRRVASRLPASGRRRVGPDASSTWRSAPARSTRTASIVFLRPALTRSTLARMATGLRDAGLAVAQVRRSSNEAARRGGIRIGESYAGAARHAAETGRVGADSSVSQDNVPVEKERIMGRSEQRRELVWPVVPGQCCGNHGETMRAIYAHPAATPADKDEAPSAAPKAPPTGQPAPRRHIGRPRRDETPRRAPVPAAPARRCAGCRPSGACTTAWHR